MSNNDSHAPLGSASPFERLSQRYIDNGLSVIPVAPGTKMPGEYAGGKWRGMSNWRKYSVQLPTELELDLWSRWPDAGIGLLTGALSGVVVADIDTEDKFLLKKLNDILPPSPVRKKGKKGWSSFYRFSGELNKSWRVNGKTVLDLLSDGRQTLMPGTLHPDGPTYVWLTEDTLDNFDMSQLPYLPKNFGDMMARMIEPLMTDDDRRFIRNDGPTDIVGEIAPLGFAGSYYREINTQALMRLDEWVPKMIPTAKPSASGYRCKAFWRGGEGLNVGIARSGIRDFVGDYGMTPIDLVMYAHNAPFVQAAEALRTALNIGAVENPLAPSNPPPPQKVAVPVVLPSAMEDVDPVLAAREALLRDQALAEQEEENAKIGPEFVLQAPGMLGRIAGWMTETAPKYQPELFVAAAIVVGAAAMGRLYRSTNNNWPSLYMVMIAATGEGKEHPMQCVDHIMVAAGLGDLVAGTGYTSPGAVHSTLMRKPSHVALMDEMGKLLKMSRTQGNGHGEAALDKLVEAFGRLHGRMQPANYSTMNMTSGQRAAIEDRTVHNPAISLLGATTPATFYESLTPDLIKDGFLGRLILVHSKRAHQKTRITDFSPPPADVVAWVKAIHDEGREACDLISFMNSSMPAQPITMRFEDDAMKMFDALDDELLSVKAQHSGNDLDTLLARTREKAMRLSMIVAKAMNPPKDNVIRVPAARWAIEYVRHYDVATIRAVHEERNDSLTHQLVKRVVKLIKGAKSYKSKQYGAILKLGGMPHSKLARDMRLESKQLRNILETAMEQGYITRTDGCPEAGFAGIVYWIRQEPMEEPMEEAAT